MFFVAHLLFLPFEFAFSIFNEILLIDCIIKIMESFVDSRSRNSVVKRMIELGLIAERSEILPSKRKKSKKSNQQSSTQSDNESDNSDDDSDGSDEHDTRKVRVTVKTTKKSKKVKPNKAAPRQRLNAIQMNVTDVQRQIGDIDENLKQHFAWLQESLNDAAEDAADADDDDSEDPNDGVPIVPYSMAQKEALENAQFKSILLGLGLHEPIAEMVNHI